VVPTSWVSVKDQPRMTAQVGKGSEPSTMVDTPLPNAQYPAQHPVEAYSGNSILPGLTLPC
jgi:hypothetical protein